MLQHGRFFSGEGTNQSIQELEKRIFTERLPASCYEYGTAPDIEVYLNADPQIFDTHNSKSGFTASVAQNTVNILADLPGCFDSVFQIGT